MNIHSYLKQCKMRKIINVCAIAIFILFCVSCNQHAGSTRNNSTVDETILDDSLSNDTSTYSIKLPTLSDLDFWLQNNNSTTDPEKINRLTDAYNATVVMNSLITDFDLQMRFDSEYENVVKAIENINLTHIKDTETLSKINKYKQELLYALRNETDSINQNIHNPWKANDDLYVYLSEKYHVTTFGPLDIDSLLEKFNNCPSVPEWMELIKKRGNDDMVAELEEKYRNAKDFDARCIYAIELAHAYEAAWDSWPDDAHRNPAVSKMESLMKEQHFSLYLLEIWKKWRVLYQDSEGSSKDSEIPNHIYNEYRKICARTMLSHIDKHPNDIMAINFFLVLAFKENILREGVYEFGNQYVIEKYDLFNEKYRDED